MFKYFLFLLLLIFLYFYLKSRPFRNPYKLIFIFGKKGSGKSTYLTKLAVTFKKAGWKVFSDSAIFGTYRLDNNWIGIYDFPENSVLLIDEGAIVFHQRNWKKFSNQMKDFFVLQRHKRVYVVIASQSFNVDKVIRDLCDELYLLVNYMNIFTVCKKIHRGVSLGNTQDGEGYIGDNYSWDLPFSWRFCYIPRWIYFFNSYRDDPLPKVNRIVYKFENEPELYKLTNYRYYKKRQLTDFVFNIKNRFKKDKFFYLYDFEIDIINKINEGVA